MMLLLAGLVYIWLSSGVQAADRVVVVPLGGGKPLQNVVTVAKGGGKFTDPVAAMNSITDASATNPYLLLIGPGQYTLTSALVMKPFVDVSGSGETVTWLMGAISSGNITIVDETSAIVKGANNTTLSNLSVSNTGGTGYSFGIYTTGLNITARLQQLSVYAIGGVVNIGVLNWEASSPYINGVNIAVQGTGVQSSYGIYNKTNSLPTMIGVNALVWGGGAATGIYNSESPFVVIDGANIYAYNGTNNRGVVNYDSDGVKIRRSTISGTTDGLVNSSGSINTMVSQSTIINGVSGGGYTCVACDDTAIPGRSVSTA